jgi:hypothetical protein
MRIRPLEHKMHRDHLRVKAGASCSSRRTCLTLQVMRSAEREASLFPCFVRAIPWSAGALLDVFGVAE